MTDNKEIVNVLKSIDEGIRAGFTYLILVILAIAIGWAYGEDKKRLENLPKNSIQSGH